MRIGIGDEGESIEGRQPPVHGRIGGQAGFEGMNVRREVAEALLDGIEAGECAEEGEMGRPDMRGDEDGLGAGIQRDFEEIMGGQAKDRTAVGMDIADGLQFFG